MRRLMEKQMQLARPNTVLADTRGMVHLNQKSVPRMMKYVPQTTMQIKAYELGLQG